MSSRALEPIQGGEVAVVPTSPGELAVSAQQAMARYEVESAIIVAKKFPRNEDAAYGRLMKSCERASFADLVRYSYPRGGQQIEGPSVNLLREAARCWANIRHGCDIVHDDDEIRTVRGWAWDVESNTKASQDATFHKLIFRKKGGWVKPDERDLRELTNKHGAICVRNCLKAVMPADLIDEAMRIARETLEKDAANDPEEARRKMIRAFQGIGVSVDNLEAYLGHPLKQASPTEVANLRAVWKSISDGNSTWAEYAPKPVPEPATSQAGGQATMDDLLGTAKPAAEQPTTEDPSAAEQDEMEAHQAETEFRGLIMEQRFQTEMTGLLQQVDAHPKLSQAAKDRLHTLAKDHLAAQRASRGERSNRPR